MPRTPPRPIDRETLGALRGCVAGVHFSCFAPGCRDLRMRARNWGLTLTLEAAIERWGEAVTIGRLQARARCQVCGHAGRHIIVDVSFPRPRMGAYGWDGGYSRSRHEAATHLTSCWTPFAPMKLMLIS